MPYRPYINKIVQTSRADDIRHYNIVLIYNKKELHTAVPFYYCFATVENPRFYRGKKKA